MFTLNGSAVKVACVMVREWDKGSNQSVECTLINEKFESVHLSIDQFYGYDSAWKNKLAQAFIEHADIQIDADSIEYLNHYLIRFMDDNNVQVIEHKCYVPRLKDL